MTNFDESKIYSYLDKNGIPYRELIGFGVKVQINEDDLFQDISILQDNEVESYFKKGDYIFSKLKQKTIVKPNLPKEFGLTDLDQDHIVKKWFFETTGFYLKDFNCLKEIPILNGNPIILQVLRDDEKFFVFATSTIKGELVVSNKNQSSGFLGKNWLRTLSGIKKIKGDLYVDIDLINLGDLEEIIGNLSFSNHVYQSKLETLSPLKKVTKDVYLKNTHLRLGTLEFIGGNLNLRKTLVNDLGNLKEVKGNVLLTKSQIDKLDFSQIKVGGKIRVYNDDFNQGRLTLPNY